MSEGNDQSAGGGAQSKGCGCGSGPMERGMKMGREMMDRMGKGGPSPMAMMQKMMAAMPEEGSMPPMMRMCMGMCAEMLGAIKQTTEMAALATPELHRLFEEWLGSLEEEALDRLRAEQELDAAKLATALGVSEESAAYLMARLASRGKINWTARASEDGRE